MAEDVAGWRAVAAGTGMPLYSQLDVFRDLGCIQKLSLLDAFSGTALRGPFGAIMHNFPNLAIWARGSQPKCPPRLPPLRG